MPGTAARERGRRRYIYLACPWTPVGGGMFRVVDYLLQAQAEAASAPTDCAELRPLDTRGGGSASYSLWVLATALVRLVRGRLDGRLAGVHVNMAERLSVLRKGSVIATCRLLGVPVVLHLHAAQLHRDYRLQPPALRAITRWVFSLPDSCVVLGSAGRQFVVEKLGVSAERVDVVANGVPEPLQQRRRSTDGPRRVLFVGNLSERKGVTDLLQALALLGSDADRLQVSVAGGGDVEAYRAKARQLGLEGLVSFEGWCDQQRVAILMARADVLVLPSYDEGLPLVILEALANGVAVVCSPVGEIPSVLTDGVDACFVQPGDVAGIAETLQRVLRQPALRHALERNGRALYERRFSLVRFFGEVARVHRRRFGVAGQAAQQQGHQAAR